MRHDETKTASAKEIEAKLREIAPYPEYGNVVTSERLARYLTVRSQLAWARNLTPFVPDDMLAPIPGMMADFAAAHALLALAEVDQQLADRVATQITEAWNDGPGVGEWLYEHLAKLGVNPETIYQLDEARLALEKAQQAERAAPAQEGGDD